MKPTLGPLLIITDRHQGPERSIIDDVARVLSELKPGGAVVELREKDLPARELMALAQKVLTVTRDRRCPLLINDRLDVALAAGVDGVHLPENGLEISAARRLAGSPDFLVGVSTHSADAAGAASRDGADLVIFGPVFDTPAKRKFGPPLGIAVLKQAATSVRASGAAALYAVGGFQDEEAVRQARAAGAHGVAAIRAFTGDEAAMRAQQFTAALRP